MALQVYSFSVGYNLGRWGWTDDFYYQQDEGVGFAGLRGAARAFWNVRRAGLSSDVEMIFVRIGRLAQTLSSTLVPLQFKAGKPVLLFTPASLAMGKFGTQSPAALNPWAAVLSTIYAGSGTLRRPWLIRGLPKSWVSTVPEDIVAFPAANLTLWWNRMLGECLSAGAGPGGAFPFPGSFGMKRIARPLAPVPVPEVVDIDITPQGYLKYYFETEPPFEFGDPVTVSGVRLSCGKGANGNFTVKTFGAKGGTDTHDGNFTVTVFKRWCCQTAPFLKTNGIMTFRSQEFTAFDPFTAGGQNSAITGGYLSRVVNRKTGRPFAGTHGRGKACCG